MTADFSDDTLFDTLQAALAESDPPPLHLRSAALAAFSWRGIDRELATLVFDSATEGELAVRSGSGPRQVSFSAPGIDIDLMIEGDRRRIVGQLLPPQTLPVTLTTGDRFHSTTSDELGRFRFADVEDGTIRITVTTGNQGGQVIRTDWIVI